jgi:ribonucleoside-triphosphate reductase (thioredoxin)
MPSSKKTAAKASVLIKKIKKRDGTVVNFDIKKINTAIWKAMKVAGEGSEREAERVGKTVYQELEKLAKREKEGFVPTVEGTQDMVETALIKHQFAATSKAYILYRERRSEVRRERGEIPKQVRELALQSKKYFRNQYSELVYYRTYSRWMESENRRETWIETVDRYMSFMQENLGTKLKAKEYDEVRNTVLRQEAMPSMRLLQFAGPAARNTHVCAYNCSFIAPSKIQDFGEIVYISMCGTGCGFAVESANVQQLPQIKTQTGKKLPTFVVPDSKEGWADALVHGMQAWFNGEDVEFDYSLLRPAGARLKTFGGKSSGPEPLRQLLTFTREKLLKRQGRRLTNLDAHDIICKIGDCVVAGGVRRSALISLSDLDDEQLRDAKKGQFWMTEPQRSLANNSAVYIDKPSNVEFMKEWLSLAEGGTGERGIFNRGSLAETLPKRRLEVLKDYLINGKIDGPIGTNPCGEIILQSKQFCNLTEVIARPNDTLATLKKKIRIATILGTYQSTLTKFGYLSKDWTDNCETERLLGVSITGQWDCPAVRRPEALKALKEEALKVNREFAKRFGVNVSTCITCVKPSGNLSQTVDCSSGMHPRHAPYYIRRIRIAATDALFKLLKDQGVPYHPEVGQTVENAHTYVLEFPIKSPKSDHYKDDLTALDQLEYWKMVKLNFTEHNPSVTVSVGDDEWIKVANWVYSNWNIIGGLSFLPRSNHIYQLAPYEEITKARYQELVDKMPELDFSKIVLYEQVDETNVAKEAACVAGVCEIDIPVSEVDKKDEK